eukprot:g9902.t1
MIARLIVAVNSSLFCQGVFVLLFAVVASLNTVVGQVRAAYLSEYSFIVTEAVSCLAYVATFGAIFLFRWQVLGLVSADEMDFVWGTGACAKCRPRRGRGAFAAGDETEPADHSDVAAVDRAAAAQYGGFERVLLRGLLPSVRAQQAGAPWWVENRNPRTSSTSTSTAGEVEDQAEFSRGTRYLQSGRTQHLLPMWIVLSLAGALNVVSEILGFVVQPYMRVFTQSLVTQSNLVFTAFWSMLLFGRRYVFAEVAALSLAVFGCLVDLKADVDKGGVGGGGALSSSTHRDSPLCILINFLSCAAPYMVLKELVFVRWQQRSKIIARTTGAGAAPPNKPGLDIFLVSATSNLFGLLFCPVAIFVLTKLRFPEQPVSQVWADAAHAVWHDEDAFFWTLQVYMPLNLLLNVGVIFILATPPNGALLLFVAFKLALPGATLLAVYLPWPDVIGRQGISPLEMLGGCIVFAATFLFLHGGRERRKLEGDVEADSEGGSDLARGYHARGVLGGEDGLASRGADLLLAAQHTSVEQHMVARRSRSLPANNRRICMHPYADKRKLALLLVLLPPVLFLVFSIGSALCSSMN